MANLICYIIIAIVVYNYFTDGDSDTVIERGRSLFRGRYKTTSGMCRRCDGTGHVHGRSCRKCGGTGRYRHTTWYR